MKQNFLTLDGMRGVAAIFVLISHTGTFWNGLIFNHTHLAVDTFFILSGFVIAHAYENKLTSGQITFKDFFIIRLIRLYPMFFIATLFATVVIVWNYGTSEHQNADYLSSLVRSIGLTFLLLPSMLIDSNKLFPLNGAYWSIFYELVVNFFYAAIIRVLTNKVLIYLIAFLSILIMSVLLLNGTLGAGFTWRYTSIITGLTRSGFGIFFGIYLYRVGKRFFPNLVLPSWVVIGLSTAVLMIPDLGKFNGVVDFLAVFIIFPLCIVLGARNNSSLLFNSIYKLLGQVSYPIYLLHIPIAALIYLFGLGQLMERNAPISGILFVILIIILSIFLERFFDLPLRKYFRDRFLKQT